MKLRLAPLFVALVLPLMAQEKPATGTVPQYLMEQMNGLEKNYVRLAEAIPAEKYTWRPGAGVRSISEVLLHVASANYAFPTMAGTPAATGVDVRGLEKSTTDKAKVIEIVRASYAYARQALAKQSEKDFEKPIKLFGRETQAREPFLVMNHHQHEHMGQLIAYARLNGIVPPWTEDRLQQEQKKK